MNACIKLLFLTATLQVETCVAQQPLPTPWQWLWPRSQSQSSIFDPENLPEETHKPVLSPSGIIKSPSPSPWGLITPNPHMPFQGFISPSPTPSFQKILELPPSSELDDILGVLSDLNNLGNSVQRDFRFIVSDPMTFLKIYKKLKDLQKEKKDKKERGCGTRRDLYRQRWKRIILNYL